MNKNKEKTLFICLGLFLLFLLINIDRILSCFKKPKKDYYNLYSDVIENKHL
jgi:hypothetical protein